MSSTRAIYLQDTFKFDHDEAVVLDIITTPEDNKIVILNETIFHPQGGGQPYDVGIITNNDSSVIFKVEKVLKNGEQVHHLGKFDPPGSTFQNDEHVKLNIDREIRLLNASIHSAGHLIDLAVQNVGYTKWTPGKGFHFSQSPYVEYNHNGQFEKEQEMIQKLELELSKLLTENGNVKIEIVPYNRVCQTLGISEVPSYLVVNQPVRMVTYGSVTCPCSGTHVQTYDQIGKKVIIKSAKKKGDKVRVSYKVE
jgi:Ser-tRNA(Ala) deacylase AlaX